MLAIDDHFFLTMAISLTLDLEIAQCSERACRLSCISRIDFCFWWKSQWHIKMQNSHNLKSASIDSPQWEEQIVFLLIQTSSAHVIVLRFALVSPLLFVKIAHLSNWSISHYLNCIINNSKEIVCLFFLAQKENRIIDCFFHFHVWDGQHGH